MSEFKNCPYCGEEIRLQAKKCKHCGEWLEEDKAKKIEKIVNLVEEVASVKQANEDQIKKTSHLKQEETIEKTSLPSAQHDNFWYDIMTGNKTSNWVVIIAFILFVIVHLSIPSYDRHEQKIYWDLQEMYKEDINSGSGDEFTNVLQSNDLRDEFLRKFHKGNSISYDKNWFWSTAKIENVNYPEGEQVSFGIFGMVFTRIGKNDVSGINNDWLKSEESIDNSRSTKSRGTSGKPDTSNQNSEYYNDAGTKAYQKGDYSKAIENYRLAVEYDSNFAEAYGNLGLAYHKAGLIDEALDANEKAIYLAKDNKTRASANYNMGRVYEDIEQYHTALEYYKIAQGFVSNATYQKAISRLEDLLNY